MTKLTARWKALPAVTRDGLVDLALMIVTLLAMWGLWRELA